MCKVIYEGFKRYKPNLECALQELAMAQLDKSLVKDVRRFGLVEERLINARKQAKKVLEKVDYEKAN